MTQVWAKTSVLPFENHTGDFDSGLVCKWQYRCSSYSPDRCLVSTMYRSVMRRSVQRHKSNHAKHFHLSVYEPCNGNDTALKGRGLTILRLECDKMKTGWELSVQGENPTDSKDKLDDNQISQPLFFKSLFEFVLTCHLYNLIAILFWTALCWRVFSKFPKTRSLETP